VGRRIDSPHVFKVLQLKRERSCIYYVTEFLEGQSLAQWILDKNCQGCGKTKLGSVTNLSLVIQP